MHSGEPSLDLSAPIDPVVSFKHALHWPGRGNNGDMTPESMIWGLECIISVILLYY